VKNVSRRALARTISRKSRLSSASADRPHKSSTVSEYAQVWLAREGAKSSAGRGLAPSTITFYRHVLDYYVIPSVGARSLSTLSVDDVESMMDSLAAAGRSARTIRGARNALGRLLRAAKREGLVTEVVTMYASHARRALADEEGPVAKALAPDQLRRLLEVVAGTKWEPLVVTLAMLGVRRGEALGLSWSDVDLDAGVITICKSLARVTVDERTQLVLSPTKTRASRRSLPLPPYLASLLRVWRLEQARQRLQASEAWSVRWAHEDLVFTTPLGTPVDPDNLRRALDRLGHEAGIGRVRPHELRHSVASILIAHGHTAPEVARFLGHSNPSVTLTFYAHAFDRAGVRAVETVANAIAETAISP
jgi:integrase